MHSANTFPSSALIFSFLHVCFPCIVLLQTRHRKSERDNFSQYKRWLPWTLPKGTNESKQANAIEYSIIHHKNNNGFILSYNYIEIFHVQLFLLYSERSLSMLNFRTKAMYLSRKYSTTVIQNSL